MNKLAVCPDINAYHSLASGQLSAETKESLLRHLEGCDSCVRKVQALPAQDSLIACIQQIKTSSGEPQDKQLAPLIQRLIQLRQTGAAPKACTFAFSCPGCGKALRVKEEAAGKKVKCPHCGKVGQTPATERPEAAAETPPAAQETGVFTPAEAGASAPLTKAALVSAAALNRSSEETHLHASSKDQKLCSFLAPAQAADELGRLGPYRVLKVLGAGGMGVVFRAEDPQLQRLVALKAMLPDLAANESARQRFLREARAAAKLKHDHIVSIYQVGEDRGAPFLAMEFLEGEALEDRLKREGKLPMAEVTRIGREIAEGLQAAHEHGLIHRDIKPGNVWLEGKRGRAKILDFGLARSAKDDVHLTQSGAIVGTPAYMPPEQARGEAVDGRCDLYSLGCVLYRLCTGELPFKGDNTMSLLLALATEQPKSVREINADVPPPLADLIMRLLAKDPAQRPATAGEVAEALSVIDLDNPVVVKAAHTPVPPRRRRRLALVAAGGALFLAGILAVIVIVRNKRGEVIARVSVPAGGNVEIKDKEGSQNLSKRQGGRDDLDAAKIPPPIQVAEPPPLAEWLTGRTILTVSQDGKGQFKTIKAALDALKPHQVVKVLDRGPYRESLQVGALPADTGLISERQTVLEIPSWPNGSHGFGPLDGFRLSGFRLLAPPPNARWNWMSMWNRPSGLVIEDCCFAWTKPSEEDAIELLFENSEPDCKPVVVRNCLFDSASFGFGTPGGSVPTVVLQRNYFKHASLASTSGRFQKVLIRHNVFDSPRGVIWVEKLKEVSEILEISNNTFVTNNHPVSIMQSAPKSGIVIRNNCSDRAIGLDAKALADAGDSVKNWQLDHNCYIRRGVLPKSSSDVLAEPPFLSVDPSHPDYMRITADGPAAKGGAGGDWPSYIGALPPGPAPKGGDWFTRLRQRWGELAPAVKPPSAPVQVPEPPPLAEWLKGRTVLTVAQDGSGQFKTIQEALNALQPHQVVKVLDRGPYRERLELLTIPEDAGLISEQRTVLEIPQWKGFQGHEFAGANGFRLNGFELLAPAKKDFAAVSTWGPAGLVIENCFFKHAGESIASINLDLGRTSNNPPSAAWIRNCVIAGSLTCTANDNGRSTVVVEQNYFCGVGGIWCEAELKKLLVRRNVFEGGSPKLLGLKETPAALEISNNTLLKGVHFVKSAPAQRVTIRNNIIGLGVSFSEGAWKFGADADKNWKVGQNCYREYHEDSGDVFPKFATDCPQEPKFLSDDPTNRDYLRLPAESPQAKGGAGGAWPSYIGALPPGPAPKDGDWFTRLREKWLKDKPAAGK